MSSHPHGVNGLENSCDASCTSQFEYSLFKTPIQTFQFKPSKKTDAILARKQERMAAQAKMNADVQTLNSTAASLYGTEE
jgi:hypothetical protein